MNTYTYKCLDCGNMFGIMATIEEKEGGMSDKFTCPKCHSKNTKQEFSAGNFIKNVFQGNKGGGNCCSGGNTCGASCKPDEKDKKIKSNGGCCG